MWITNAIYTQTHTHTRLLIFVTVVEQHSIYLVFFISKQNKSRSNAAITLITFFFTSGPCARPLKMRCAAAADIWIRECEWIIIGWSAACRQFGSGTAMPCDRRNCHRYVDDMFALIFRPFSTVPFGDFCFGAILNKPHSLGLFLFSSLPQRIFFLFLFFALNQVYNRQADSARTILLKKISLYVIKWMRIYVLSRTICENDNGMGFFFFIFIIHHLYWKCV